LRGIDLRGIHLWYADGGGPDIDGYPR
jgi:hypothetical protein